MLLITKFDFQTRGLMRWRNGWGLVASSDIEVLGTKGESGAWLSFLSDSWSLSKDPKGLSRLASDSRLLSMLNWRLPGLSSLLRLVRELVLMSLVRIGIRVIFKRFRGGQRRYRSFWVTFAFVSGIGKRLKVKVIGEEEEGWFEAEICSVKEGKILWVMDSLVIMSVPLSYYSLRSYNFIFF